MMVGIPGKGRLAFVSFDPVVFVTAILLLLVIVGVLDVGVQGLAAIMLLSLVSVNLKWSR
jgi:hypothetical protein